MTRKYKIGDDLTIKTGKALEFARHYFIEYFPKFYNHSTYISDLDLIVMTRKKLRVSDISFWENMDKVVLKLDFEYNGEILSCHKIEDLLIAYIDFSKPLFEELIKSEVYYADNEKYEQQLLSKSLEKRYEAAKRLKNYLPNEIRYAIHYYIALEQFEKLLEYGEKIIPQLIEYLSICAEEKNIERIFNVFYKLGVVSTGALLSLLTLKNYAYRHVIYKVIGEIGAKESIVVLSTMKSVEDKHTNELNNALTNLNKRFEI
jgi:hypothetical protein